MTHNINSKNVLHLKKNVYHKSKKYFPLMQNLFYKYFMKILQFQRTTSIDITKHLYSKKFSDWNSALTMQNFQYL